MSVGNSTVQSVKLTGFRLRAARALWLGMAVFTIFLFIAGIRPSFEIGLRLLPESQDALRAAGLPMKFPAYVLVIMDSITVLFFGVIAFILVWLRGGCSSPRRWIAAESFSVRLQLGRPT